MSVDRRQPDPAGRGQAPRRRADRRRWPPGDVAMIVSFSDSARVEQTFTDNRRELRSAARRRSSRPTARRSSARPCAWPPGWPIPAGHWRSAKRRSPRACRPRSSSSATASFPTSTDFALGNLEPVYVPIGEVEAPNLGIVAFSTGGARTRRTSCRPSAAWRTSGRDDVTADVELYRDGTLVDASKLDVKPHESGGVAFDLGDMHSGSLRAARRVRRRPERRRRSLGRDRSAAAQQGAAGHAGQRAAGIGPARPKVPRNWPTSTVAKPEVLDTKEYQQKAAAGYYALVIYDRCQPKQMPQANTLFIGALPPGTRGRPAKRRRRRRSSTSRRRHPLMQLIDLGNVMFAEATPLKPPPGSTVLIEPTSGRCSPSARATVSKTPCWRPRSSARPKRESATPTPTGRCG